MCPAERDVCLAERGQVGHLSPAGSGCGSTGHTVPHDGKRSGLQAGCGSGCEGPGLGLRLGLAQPSSTRQPRAHLPEWESAGAHHLQLPSVAFE